MDVWEATQAVFDRVRAVDPENASRMMGLLLIRDNCEHELTRLALGPDHLVHSFMAAARAELAVAAGATNPSSPPSPSPALAPPPPPPPQPQQQQHTWGHFSGGGGADHQLVGYDGDAFYGEDYDVWSPSGGGGSGGGGGAGVHRRSFSLSDAEAAAAAGGWRPCMYYARGFCKNGNSCRFLHGVPEEDADMAAVMRAKALAAAVSPPPPPPPPQQQLMASAYPYSPSPKASAGGGVSLSFLLHQHQHQLQHHQHQQQQSEAQRAAAAGMVVGGGEEMHGGRFPAAAAAVRGSPRMDRGDSIGSPAARQIYLTFPADSTFSEEDVSNYFSMFGPVQDVRIPYQQKRMFGFVTFVYAETVKTILSKGNPHFVCDARVLVKPYKEKGKVPDRFRKMQHAHHGGEQFAGCTSPTGLLDSRDPYDLQQPQIGPRMMYGNMANHQEAFLRRKMEEQHQAAELQQAIELESRRFMGLHLLDLKNRGGHHLGLGSHVGSLGQAAQADGGKGSGSNGNNNGNAAHLEDVIGSIQDKRKMSRTSSFAMSAPAAAAATDAEGKHEEEQQGEGGGDGSPGPKQAVNPGEEETMESGPVTATPNAACGFQESGVVEHILPDSPFASPTKAFIDTIGTATAQNGSISNSSPHHVASSLFPPASTLELAPYNSCFFQVPRFSPGHEAIGL